MGGTHFFMSPEAECAESKETVDGKLVDIWAFGITLFSFTFMELPFYNEDLEDLINSI